MIGEAQAGRECNLPIMPARLRLTRQIAFLDGLTRKKRGVALGPSPPFQSFPFVTVFDSPERTPP